VIGELVEQGMFIGERERCACRRNGARPTTLRGIDAFAF